MFSFNIWNIICTVLNLIIFYLLMKKFFFKPIMKAMDKRQALIDDQFKLAQDKNDEADKLNMQYQQKIKDADVEKEKIINEAKDDAKVVYDKILDRAKVDAQTLKDDAKKQIELETQNARQAAKEEMTSLAMKAAEKVVKTSVSIQTDSDIFDEFLNEGSED